MSRKRHYERFTNRALPPSPPGGSKFHWFEGEYAERNWNTVLGVTEQTRSEYMRKLKANPNLDRSREQFDAYSEEGVSQPYSAEQLDRFIQGLQQQHGLPMMPDDPTPDQLQEALTQLSEVLKPQPYQKQDGEPPPEGEGEGEGEGEDEDEGEGEGKEREQEQRPPPKPQQKPPQKPQGRPKKPDKPKQPQAKKQQQKQQKQQIAEAPQQRPDEDVDHQEWNEAPEVPDLPKRPMSTNGGGEQTYSTPEDIAFWQARNAIINLCVARTPLERPELGDEPYNLRRVVKSAYNPAMLTSIRDQLGLTVDDVYLLLDTSGSVSHYAPLIASVAAAAAGIVHIYTGTEARPQYKVVRSSPLVSAHDDFPEWKTQKALQPDRSIFRGFAREYQSVVHHGYPDSPISITFEAEMAWFLEKEQPPKGSHIIIWTDTEGCAIHNPLALRALLADYKVTLMMPASREEVSLELRGYASGMGIETSPGGDAITAAVAVGLEVTDNSYRMYCEVFKFLAIDIPVIFGVVDGVTFAQALRQL